MTPPTSTSEVPSIPDASDLGSEVHALPIFHLYSFMIGVLTTACLLGAALWLSRRPEAPAITLHPPPTLAPTATALPTPTPAPITVFVSGAVARPGLYALDAGSRVGDALHSAGGLTAVADPALVNQAEPLWDGAQIHVPSPMDGAEAEAGATLLLAQPPSGVSGTGGSGSGAGTGSVAAAAGKININAAGATELESLPGIGPSKAEAIIANRPYSSIDDLERVPGIGPKTIDQLREQIAVD